MNSVKSVLIANRGEPVRRAMRTLRQLGIQVVTIATTADRVQPWVAESDLCLSISSYLAGDEIVAKAKAAGVDAIWPGWGFLSENEGFAQSVVMAGMIWVGPSPAVIAAMGSKDEASRRAREAGLRIIPEVVLAGNTETNEACAQILSASRDAGFPILLKPALGGGGQGQAIITNAEEIKSSWEAVCRINEKQFQSGPVLVQRYFTDARHIEAQVLCDQHGHAVILGERDCSIQRRNQKVLEEAPSPALTQQQRDRLVTLSTNLVRHIRYDNVGTIEYLFSDGEFFFLEMNTRLQVEHTVTEETARVRGEKLDLIAEMLRLAQGDPLSFQQSEVTCVGHAIEARIYAEDPRHDFRPAPGRVVHLEFPQLPHLRIESAMGAHTGIVSAEFDPMIAKMICWGKDREASLTLLRQALSRTVILGVPTNVSFCTELLEQPEIQSGDYTTRYIGQHKSVRGESVTKPGLAFALAAVFRYVSDLGALRDNLRSHELTSLSHLLRQIPQNAVSYELELLGKKTKAKVFEESPDIFRVSVLNREFCFRFVPHATHGFTVTFADHRVLSLWAHSDDGDVQMTFAGHPHSSFVGGWFRFKINAEGDASAAHDAHAAPVSGQVVAVFVKVGDVIKPGQELFQIESMKMVTTIRAAHDGAVMMVHKNVGDVVKAKEAVVVVPAEAAQSRTSQNDHWEAETDTVALCGQGLLTPAALLTSYCLGYDVSQEHREVALNQFTHTVQSSAVAELLRYCTIVHTLFTEHEHSMAFLAERGSGVGNCLPSQTTTLLKELLPVYGLKEFTEWDFVPRPLIRLFQAHVCEREERDKTLAVLAQICCDSVVGRAAVAEALAAWLKTKPILDETMRQVLFDALCAVDAGRYLDFARFPVAPEYLDEFRNVTKDPAFGVDVRENEKLIATIRDTKSECVPLDFHQLGHELAPELKKWFQAFQGRILPLPHFFAEKNVFLFEFCSVENETKNRGSIPRFVVVALVGNSQIARTATGQAHLPGFEMAAIAAYRTLRLVQGISPHGPNHVFLIPTSSQSIPWKAREQDHGHPALTPDLARTVAKRVSGFANDIQILATEVILPLQDVGTKESGWSVIEVRHAKPFGVISRPPFPLEDRKPEALLDEKKRADENQHRMGKLLNEDRAKLLFDAGEFRELKFPEVDDATGIGLVVYSGVVNGVPTLAYASDFRVRGGALGEREGKKLAACVVLAHLSNRPLIGFHDGAGANIKESVASLGWAGAYFGAIANTGGFSSPQQFQSWFEDHHDRGYFEKVLHHFGLNGSLASLVQDLKRPLVHMHLHVGATVGMLVYGAAISHMSLMNDQPESYRVLTGAGTVAQVMGEKLTNYELGGAKVHGEISGDIDGIFTSEEQVINRSRELIQLFFLSKKEAQILRLPNTPHFDVPREAGVIFGRDALKANVDRGVFYEIRSTLKHATGLTTGYAALAGQPVVLVALATDYGLSHEKMYKKATLMVEAATEFRIPLIFVYGAHWDGLVSPMSVGALRARTEFLRALAQSRVPKVALALGSRSVEKIIHTYFDLFVSVKRGAESAFEREQLAQLSPVVVDTVTEAFDRVAQILPFLTRHFAVTDTDPIERSCQMDLPEDTAKSYEMTGVIAEIFDRDSFVELWGQEKVPLVTGFARLGGVVVGVIADNPAIESGAQNVDSIAKFTRLHRLCERFDLPLIELSDSPAFRPGSEQEQGGIQTEGGKSIREECLSAIPKVVATLRQNYGGRLIHANLVTLGPPRAGLIVAGAKVGVMGAKGATAVLYRKQLAALPEVERAVAQAKWHKAYEQEQLAPQNAVALGYVAPPIPAAALRAEIYKTLTKLIK